MPGPEESMAYFSFSIPTRKGSSRGGLAYLIGRMQNAGIRVHSLTGFVAGPRTRLYCAPVAVAAFRAFARQEKLRLTEKTAVRMKFRPVLNLLQRWAMSGEIHPAFSAFDDDEGFIYLKVKRH